MTRYCFGNLPPDVYANNLEALNLLLNLVRPKSFVSTHASTSLGSRVRNYISEVLEQPSCIYTYYSSSRFPMYE